MTAGWVVQALKEAGRRHETPKIINSDQGVQFTSGEYIEYIKSLEAVSISMYGKGQATDNAYIDRWFRTVKHKNIYLNPAPSALELHQGIGTFVEKYNRRRHQGINRRKPIELYGYAA